MKYTFKKDKKNKIILDYNSNNKLSDFVKSLLSEKNLSNETLIKVLNEYKSSILNIKFKKNFLKLDIIYFNNDSYTEIQDVFDCSALDNKNEIHKFVNQYKKEKNRIINNIDEKKNHNRQSILLENAVSEIVERFNKSGKIPIIKPDKLNILKNYIIKNEAKVINMLSKNITLKEFFNSNIKLFNRLICLYILLFVQTIIFNLPIITMFGSLLLLGSTILNFINIKNPEEKKYNEILAQLELQEDELRQKLEAKKIKLEQERKHKKILFQVFNFDFKNDIFNEFVKRDKKQLDKVKIYLKENEYDRLKRELDNIVIDYNVNLNLEFIGQEKVDRKKYLDKLTEIELKIYLYKHQNFDNLKNKDISLDTFVKRCEFLGVNVNNYINDEYFRRMINSYNLIKENGSELRLLQLFRLLEVYIYNKEQLQKKDSTYEDSYSKNFLPKSNI